MSAEDLDPYDFDFRPCDRCGDPIPIESSYAWCEKCQESGTCRHGKRPEDCDRCMTESDFAYDESRE